MGPRTGAISLGLNTSLGTADEVGVGEVALAMMMKLQRGGGAGTQAAMLVVIVDVK